MPGTRHNIGWSIAEEFAARRAEPPQPGQEVQPTFSRDNAVLKLALPQTYMNASGARPSGSILDFIRFWHLLIVSGRPTSAIW